jgi:hypothetical protein
MKRFKINPSSLVIRLSVAAFLIFLGTDLHSQISISKQDATCDLASDGSATATVAGGTPPYSYSWSNGGTGPAIDHLSPGIYTVTVSDANGCSGSRSVGIVALNSLTLTISGANAQIEFCNNQAPPEITLTAVASGGTPPYTYTWPGASITINSTGTYTCSVTDMNYCTASASIYVVFIPVQCSEDPNEILGTEGYGEDQWVSVNEKLSYTVYFENDPDFATAPAQEVRITIPVSDKADPYTLRVGDFGFGDFIFPVPPNTSYYTQRLDVVDSLGVFVDVIAGIDVVNEKAFWIFQSIDPATGLPPTGLQSGFLPVNDSIRHLGEGFVTFNFRPKTNDLTGDSIKTQAHIIFDINDPLGTNAWSNTVDAFPPASTVDSIPPDINSSTFDITFNGQDDPGGCGISKFQLYFSKDSGPFTLFGEYDPGEVAHFISMGNSNYGFFSIARDHVGNTEPMKTQPDVTTTIGGVEKSLNLIVFLEGLYDSGNAMRQARDETGPHFGPGIADKVTVELHNANNYSSVAFSSGPVNLKTNGTITITGIPVMLTGPYYITIRHRNSIETTSANPVSFTGNVINYNFTSGATQAYGDNLGNKNGIFVVYGGDVNQDGIVDSDDMNLVDNALTAIIMGYVNEDLNGDGIVDAGDYNIVDNNQTAIVIALTP